MPAEETIWILEDQLQHDHPALVSRPKSGARLLFIESEARCRHLRYHQQRLVLLLSAMRHFASARKQEGWKVDCHSVGDTPDVETGLRRHLAAHNPAVVRVMDSSDWTTRQAVSALPRKLGFKLESMPTNQFLVPDSEFKAWAGTSKRLLMENHYRRVRRKQGWLMAPDGAPEGGAWNLDADNRKTFAAWNKAGRPLPPPAPKAAPDALTRAAIAEVERLFPDHPGQAAAFAYPVTREDSLAWLRDFIRHRLPNFGPYEDLMASADPRLFHSVLTPMLNLGLLRPAECVEAAIAAWRAGKAPLNSVEGFVRQIAGWREFVNGVYQLRMPEYATLNALGASRPLPAFFYSGETPMRCLATVLRQLLDTGFNHHIQRLMVLGNFLLLAGVRPQEALRWFNEMYVDAHDWVMAANVLGMVLHADGGFMATKPYAAGPGYISRMSDYCKGCRFRPDQREGADACPFHALYWNFIGTHAPRFARNPRMAVIIRSWEAKAPSEKRAIRARAEAFLGSLES